MFRLHVIWSYTMLLFWRFVLPSSQLFIYLGRIKLCLKKMEITFTAWGSCDDVISLETTSHELPFCLFHNVLMYDHYKFLYA